MSDGPSRRSARVSRPRSGRVFLALFLSGFVERAHIHPELLDLVAEPSHVLLELLVVRVVACGRERAIGTPQSGRGGGLLVVATLLASKLRDHPLGQTLV